MKRMQYYQQYPSHISMENEDINNLDEDEEFEGEICLIH